MNKIQEQTGAEGRHQQYRPSAIKYDLALNTLSAATLSEFFKTEPGQLHGNTGMSARGFARADQIASAKIESAYFSAVNSPHMVATRRGGSPGIDLSSAHQNGHGVARFDFLDALPSNGHLDEGVGDCDAFIKESDFGADKNEVGQARCGTCPSDGTEAFMGVSFQQDLKTQDCTHEEDNSSHEKTAPGAKDLTIAHQAIFSREKIFTRCDIGKKVTR